MTIDHRLWIAAFWSALIFAFVMAVLPHPPQIPFNPNDKFQHMLAFGVMAVLAALAWPAGRLLVILVALSGFGALIEVVQAVPALHRDADIRDWVADTIAISGALMVVAIARRYGREKLAR